MNTANAVQNNDPGDPCFPQADREARLSLMVWAFYFVWWAACAYGLGSGDPEKYCYVLGLPAWFFWSSVAGWPLVSLIVWVLVHFFFREMPLAAAFSANEAPEAHESEAR